MKGDLPTLDRLAVSVLVGGQCFRIGHATQAWRSRCCSALSDHLIAGLPRTRKLHILTLRATQALWGINLLVLAFTTVSWGIVLLYGACSSFAASPTLTNLLTATCPASRILSCLLGRPTL